MACFAKMINCINALILLSLIQYSTADMETPRLRVMTFNIWMSGAEVDDGMKKIAAHIKHVNPDIVALQVFRVATQI